MTQEEKAKAYDEAIERAKEMCAMPSDRATMEYVFPELREDERIRRFLHKTFTAQYLAKDRLGRWHGEPVTSILAWLEKVKDFDKQLEDAYKNSDEVQYKRGYGKGYADGMVAAKQELEKQVEMPTTISVDEMVEEFIDARIEANSICQIIESEAYREGVVDTLSKILIKEEKPITIGSKKAEGKLGEMIAASKEPAESGENKELSHKEVSKKSDQDGRWKWDEDDEKFVRENILIKLGNIDGVSPELYSKIIDWVGLIKKRLS